MDNMILIGMPGAGKSTIGVVLAKTLGYLFLDTDLLIQQLEGALLQDIVNTKGVELFKKIEEDALISLHVDHTVVSTGGSAVYSAKAMHHLRSLGTVIYLQLPFAEIERRINNITTRGLAMDKGKTLHDLYQERLPLYEQYADVIVDCDGAGVEEVVAKIMAIK